ncbi:CAMK family protein kinase [Trichomonas vaginalis G3]|uniref:CAMK family protein kinase n=1 Tax=Trichomonas vaginalis (strain ATCC PRA-98 / G3) TaxID=412133 RepID=A2FY14_TRIV3|nr:protein serine/threonine kinase protein [Trichomonas vaginalis G3]EAX90213.1 CAMK family protein kinase [Trichomonas vaginalis G3]KAI5492476.1 protein serine/threonine kinase protein [Trichomonas vaginalis G3]|eukprot:XP_001303143.1 CAMK family protein kinase [Trichomonas vaginalis G3]
MNNSEIEFFQQHGLTFRNVIGEGSFGKLFLVYSSHYDQCFALKKIPQLSFHENEIECLKHICQKNIINLYNYYRFDGHVYLLMEYCPNDLNLLIHQDKEIDPELLRVYIYDILQAIKTCHDNNIAHQDIKPSNFLIDKYGRIKVCDFGLSNIYEDNPTCNTFKGTMLFMAPELFRKKEYNAMKADIWALGVTFFCMATKTYPFYCTNKQNYIKILNTGIFPHYKVASPSLREVIIHCLDLNPETRATVDELLKLAYFDQMRYHNPLETKDIGKTQSLNAIIFKPLLKRSMKLTERSTVTSLRKKIPIELLKHSSVY